MLIKNEIKNMTERSQEVFRCLVETYLETGEPVGSSTLARSLTTKVSSATVRHVMQDLEVLGLLGSPHISSGRVPTQIGLRLFVDGLLEVSDMPGETRAEIDNSVIDDSIGLQPMLDRVGSILSGLTSGASLVFTSKTEVPIKHIEFVQLSFDRVLEVLVTDDGQVENRIFEPPLGITASSLRESANFLNATLKGHTISEIRDVLLLEIEQNRTHLDTISQNLINSGVASWVPDVFSGRERLIIRGRSNLIDNLETEDDLERVRVLFDDLERKRDIEQLLDLTEGGDGVRIFIGSENKLFSLSGSSLIISPYMNDDSKVIGAVGVIGPTRLNYGRIVPIVDYTAQLLGKMISNRSA
jgi:heat-inducible transcriptional repressor